MTVSDAFQARASVLGRRFLTPYGLVACLSILLLAVLVRYAGHLALSDSQALPGRPPQGPRRRRRPDRIRHRSFEALRGTDGALRG